MYIPVFVTPDKSVGIVTDRDPVIGWVPRAVGDCLVSIIMSPRAHICHEDQPVERFAGIMDTRSSSNKKGHPLFWKMSLLTNISFLAVIDH